MQRRNEPHGGDGAEEDARHQDVDAEAHGLEEQHRFGKTFDVFGVLQPDPYLGEVDGGGEELVDDDDEDRAHPDLRLRARIADQGTGDVEREEHLEVALDLREPGEVAHEEVDEHDLTERGAEGGPEWGEERHHGQRHEDEVGDGEVEGADGDVGDDFEDDVREAEEGHREDEHHQLLGHGEGGVGACGAQPAGALIIGGHCHSFTWQRT